MISLLGSFCNACALACRGGELELVEESVITSRDEVVPMGEEAVFTRYRESVYEDTTGNFFTQIAAVI